MRGLIALTCFWSAKKRNVPRQPVSPCLFCLVFFRSSGPALHQKQLRYVAVCWSTPPLPAWLPWRLVRTLSSMNYGTQMSSYQMGERNLHSSISPLKVACERWRIPSFGRSTGINVHCNADLAPSKVKKSLSRTKVMKWLFNQLSHFKKKKKQKGTWRNEWEDFHLPGAFDSNLVQGTEGCYWIALRRLMFAVQCLQPSWWLCVKYHSQWTVEIRLSFWRWSCSFIPETA